MNIKDLLVLAGNDSRPDNHYEPRALHAGIDIEMEHTNSYEVAKVIAKTHLDERADYYSVLKQVGL